MDRRTFLSLSAASLAGWGLSGMLPAQAWGRGRKNDAYNIIILGDTHFDTEPADVYHSHYNEPTEWLNRVQRAEFARNGEMWRERCPRLVKRAACLVDENTRQVLQMGDLIQGDCGNGEVHRKMLSDVMDSFKASFGGALPLVTVVGNHDIRGTDAKAVYHDYMPKRMSEELGQPVAKTTFAYWIGPDAYIVIDFNHPDDEEVDKLLQETRKARHTFIVIHGPVLPYDAASCRWFFHGSAKPAHTQARLHFRREFATRNAIVLCGHVHRTELADWWGDGGRITQMTMNSVWSQPEKGQYKIISEGADSYGTLRKDTTYGDGRPVDDETPLFDEYRSGLRRYSVSPAAGCYKLSVDRRHVTIDFYAGDSTFCSQRFELR